MVKINWISRTSMLAEFAQVASQVHLSLKETIEEKDIELQEAMAVLTEYENNTGNSNLKQKNK